MKAYIMSNILQERKSLVITHYSLLVTHYSDCIYPKSMYELSYMKVLSWYENTKLIHKSNKLIIYENTKVIWKCGVDTWKYQVDMSENTELIYENTNLIVLIKVVVSLYWASIYRAKIKQVQNRILYNHIINHLAFCWK